MKLAKGSEREQYAGEGPFCFQNADQIKFPIFNIQFRTFEHFWRIPRGFIFI